MNYIRKPSLEYIALVNTVGMLWNEEDIANLIKKFCTPFNSTELKNEWPSIEERLKEKVPNLLLPEPLKEKILGIIKPIGSQILRWMKYLGDTCFNIYLPDEYHWTPQGLIDEKTIAELLIKNESIDIITRYKMSCIYCLEDDILKLWNKIPEIFQKTFYCEDPMLVQQSELVVLWTYSIKGEVSKMEAMIERKLERRCSPYQYAFENAANEGNRVAIDYFLKKLTSREREESLIRTAGYVAYERLYPYDKHTKFLCEYYSDILCILLTHMNKEQQTKIFQNFPCQVLKCLLDWPWQIFFVKTFHHMWHFLPERIYDCLLTTMTSKVIKGYKDFNYQKLFAENWQEVPEAYKRSVLNGYSIPFYLIPELIKIRDENNIKLIFRDATVTEKKRIIYHDGGKDTCKDLIIDEQWDLLKFFIQECLSSKEEIINFRDDFEIYIRESCSKEIYIRESCSKDEHRKIKPGNWDKFLSVVDDIISEYS